MEPIVDELEDEYGAGFDIVRVDIDTPRGRELARAHAFIGQPTFIFFDSANQETRRFQGAQAKETMVLEMDRLLNN